MADSENVNFTLKYSGASARALYEKISAQLDSAIKAHTEAIKAWRIVKGKFVLDPSIMNELNAVDEGSDALDTVQFKKVTDSLEKMMAGIVNINTTWSGVSQEISEAVKAYTSSANQGK